MKSPAIPIRRRCATYTRKSSEEGLEQDFNSLHAQREACEAFIKSQKSEGWLPIKTVYDDGGFSGGTLDRPALTRLLADIESGKIDTVVVYKVDRLTRSLADFAKIVEILDAHEVSFVSVTQQFNTTTSMGRLTLNMLLSFAQFEREVTGERIRDKIAASKRKGLWMGGNVPLGYAPNGRTLTVVESEAKTVRLLFQLYLELGSVRRVQVEADRLGLKSKARDRSNPRQRGGGPFSRGHLYRILSNPIYAGRIGHRGETHPGQHPALVEVATWEKVQKQLSEQAPARPDRKNAADLNTLRGKLFDEAGVGLTPSHTVKSGRRYRYYVSRASASRPPEKSQAGPSLRWRLPAREIEHFVSKAIRDLVSSPADATRWLRGAGIHEERIPSALAGFRDLSANPLELVRRIDLGAEEVLVQIDLSEPLGEKGAVVPCRVPVRLRRRGVEMRLVLANGTQSAVEPRADPSLVKAIVRARQWFSDLATGRVQSLREIAKTEGICDRYVGALIPLAFLAPDLVAQICAGTQPVELTADALVKRIDLPLSWAEQKRVLEMQR